MISSLQKTTLVRYWHPVQVHYMHCEFSVTTDCQLARSKTFSRYDSRKDTYCAPAWSGLCSASDRARLDAFLRRSKKYGCGDVPTTVTDLFAAADQSLFKRVLNNELHVLQPLLPDKTINCYKLRPRKHDRQWIRKCAHLNDSLFVVRMLYKDSH